MSLPKRALIDRFFDPSRKRPLEPRSCEFQHPMRPIEPGAWFCDHPMCKALLVHFDVPACYNMHKGTRFLAFTEQEAKDYLAGRQTLRQLVLTRIND